MPVGTEVQMLSGIRLIALIAMSIDPVCDLEWSWKEYLDSSPDKKYGSVCFFASGKETDLFDEVINALRGHLGLKFILDQLENLDQIHQFHM